MWHKGTLSNKMLALSIPRLNCMNVNEILIVLQDLLLVASRWCDDSISLLASKGVLGRTLIKHVGKIGPFTKRFSVHVFMVKKSFQELYAFPQK